MGSVVKLDAFRWRLAEVIAWCTNHAYSVGAVNGLRSYDLRPLAFTSWRTTEEHQAIVDILAEARLKMLNWNMRWHGKSGYPNAPAQDLAGGRLLVYDPGGNLADGAAEAHSGDFFDAENEPPWDTWVCFINNTARSAEDKARQWQPYDSYLISWVPGQFVELADKGINVNPEACILWAIDLDTPFTRQLKQIGLLG